MQYRQIQISLVSSSSLLTSGMHLGYSAVAVPHFETAGPDFLTADETSWFASIGTVATIIGCLMCGPLLDRFGRKWTLLSVNVPFVIGWLVICLTPQPVPPQVLYIGRILTGLGGGMVSIPANVYIAEMATKSMRSMLVAWPSIAISMGILIVYLFGWIVQNDWRLVAGLCLIFPVLTSILVLSTLRESPTWLVAQGRIKEAEDSLKWVRNVEKEEEMPVDVRDEYDTIVMNVSKATLEEGEDKCSAEEPAAEDVNNSNVTSRLSLLLNRDTWKPLVILNLYFFFMQFSGVVVLSSYTVNIMKFSGVTLDPYLGTFLLGVVQLAASVAATMFFNRVGRRPLSLISGVGMTVCMMFLAVYMQLSEEGMQTELSWIPLLLLMGYVISSSIGFRLLPWSMVGEVYPTRVRGLAGGITTCFAYTFGFVAVKFYPELVEVLGGNGSIGEDNVIRVSKEVFYFFGAISFIGTIFIFFFLPETLKKSLEEIREYFLK